MDNELMKVEEMNITEELTAGTTLAYCSFKVSTPEDRAKLFNAMNEPDFKVDEAINTPIQVKDVYAEYIDLLDENTGEIKTAVRMVLITPDGTSYGCVSVGMFSALKKVMKIYGEPTWKEPITIIPYTKKTRNGNNKVLTFKIA